MGRSLNRAMLIGFVGNEPDVRSTSSGNKVARFSLATSRRFKDRNGQYQEDTQWHRVTAWGRLAELVENYVGKGHRIYVEGSIEYSQSEGSDGVTRYFTDINAREVLFLDSADKPQKQGARTSTSSSPFDDDFEDVPF